MESYGRRPIWQWVMIYVVVGGLIYGLVYYFIYAKKGGYSSGNPYSPQVQMAANSVEVLNYKYSPASITVKVGDTVTWTNRDSDAHSVTADDGSFDTGLFGQGETGKVTFSKAGTYTYYCSAHPDMKGTVIVQ